MSNPESHVLNASALEAAFEEANSRATVTRSTQQTVEAAIRAYLSASQEAAAPSEEPVAWRVRERPGFDWGLVRTDPDRDPHFHCWEKQPLFASPAVAPVAVSVKGLSWKLRSVGRYRSGFKFGSYYADIYEISFRDGSYWLDDGHFSFMDQRFESAETAMVVAQKHHNARILSSIIPATKGGEDGPPRRETQEYLLRAMGTNYRAGNLWDHLDKDVVLKAADEIKALRAALSAQDTDGVAKP